MEETTNTGLTATVKLTDKQQAFVNKIIVDGLKNKTINMTNKFYVYIHYNPITNIPFYVGKGSKSRLNSIHGRSGYWNNYVNKYGFYSEKIEIDLTEDMAYQLEMYWISQLKAWGFKLVNLDNGGIGMYSGCKPSLDTRNKMKQSQKNRKPHSEQTLDKMRKANVGRKPYITGKTLEELADERLEEFKKSYKKVHKLIGRAPWNKGLTKETSEIVKQYCETREKNRLK